MKNNGKHSLCNRANLFICLATCLLAIGCRGSRNSVAETQGTVHATVKECFDTDTLHAATTAKETKAGSASLQAGECGRLDIERDSAGRPVVFYWFRHFDFQVFGESVQSSGTVFSLCGSSNRFKSSGTVDSITKEKEETTEEINPAIPLESLVGSGILILAVMYIIYTVVVNYLWPCKRPLKK